MDAGKKHSQSHEPATKGPGVIIVDDQVAAIYKALHKQFKDADLQGKCAVIQRILGQRISNPQKLACLSLLCNGGTPAEISLLQEIWAGYITPSDYVQPAVPEPEVVDPIPFSLQFTAAEYNPEDIPYINRMIEPYLDCLSGYPGKDIMEICKISRLPFTIVPKLYFTSCEHYRAVYIAEYNQERVGTSGACRTPTNVTPATHSHNIQDNNYRVENMDFFFAFAYIYYSRSSVERDYLLNLYRYLMLDGMRIIPMRVIGEEDFNEIRARSMIRKLVNERRVNFEQLEFSDMLAQSWPVIAMVEPTEDIFQSVRKAMDVAFREYQREFHEAAIPRMVRLDKLLNIAVIALKYGYTELTRQNDACLFPQDSPTSPSSLSPDAYDLSEFYGCRVYNCTELPNVLMHRNLDISDAYEYLNAHGVRPTVYDVNGNRLNYRDRTEVTLPMYRVRPTDVPYRESLGDLMYYGLRGAYRDTGDAYIAYWGTLNVCLHNSYIVGVHSYIKVGSIWHAENLHSAVMSLSPEQKHKLKICMKFITNKHSFISCVQ